MNITVTIQLAEGDDVQRTPDEVANIVFDALGADASKDFCQASIMPPLSPTGTAGMMPGMPFEPPPEE